MKSVNVNLTEEELKSIVVSIVYRQEGIKRLMERSATDDVRWTIEKKIEVDELQGLIYKLMESEKDL